MRLLRGLIITCILILILGTFGVAQGNKNKGGDGRSIFRFDTFGDEQLWTDTLRMNEPLESLTPTQALGVGLKVDSEALPASVIASLQAGQINLNDPSVTLALLDLDAVVGVIGKVNNRKLKSVGITCALCHSTVDNSVAPGIGRRLDGWPNIQLNVGAIVGLSPAISGALKAELATWGPGKYDPRHHIFDGRQLHIINSPSFPVVIPPAFGLQGVGFETYTGDGPISYWNSYVGVTQMGGHGTFIDPRIGVSVVQHPDLVTPKLPALLEYQLSLTKPAPPAGSFDAAAAARGQAVFNGAGRCSSCHIPPTYTDVLTHVPPYLHSPFEVGAETVYVSRSATKAYRTTPLRALWQHPPYFHDGHARTLMEVVEHYNRVLTLNLTAQQKADLVEFLKTL
jgi:hypothetical protein